MSKLSDTELSEMTAKCETHNGGDHRVHKALAELRELRALLATPWPCGWPEPEVVALPRTYAKEGERGVAWELIDQPDDEPLTPDEAEALAAGLMRAALAARGGE